MLGSLKNSILGIVLLGAIGSLLAVGILKLSAFILRRIVKPKVNSIIGAISAGIEGPFRVIDQLGDSSDVRQVLVTAIALIAIEVFSASLFVFGGVILFVSAALPPSARSAISVLFGSTSFFLGLFLIRKSLNYVFALYSVYMGEIEEKVAQIGKNSPDSSSDVQH